MVSLIHECDFSAEILPLMISSATARKIDRRLIDCLQRSAGTYLHRTDMMTRESLRLWAGQDQLETVRAIVDIWRPPRIQLSDGGVT